MIVIGAVLLIILVLLVQNMRSVKKAKMLIAAIQE